MTRSFDSDFNEIYAKQQAEQASASEGQATSEKQQNEADGEVRNTSTDAPPAMIKYATPEWDEAHRKGMKAIADDVHAHVYSAISWHYPPNLEKSTKADEKLTGAMAMGHVAFSLIKEAVDGLEPEDDNLINFTGTTAQRKHKLLHKVVQQISGVISTVMLADLSYYCAEQHKYASEGEKALAAFLGKLLDI